jgi:murein DD-endopeptidase MepM/ murein hydrolase activator NlpD
MKQKNVILVCVTVFICLFIFSIPTASSSALYAEPKPAAQDQQTIENQVEQAVLDAIASNESYVQKGFVSTVQVTDIKISSDKNMATAWLVYYDPQIDAVVPTEPGLAVTHLVNAEWQVFLPPDPGWQIEVSNTPDDLLTAGEKEMWLTMSEGTVEAITAQGGYLLPWHGGRTVNLSRSVGHDASFTSGTSHFAFDFYISGVNFEVYAARAGTVWAWKDSVADGNHSDVNFLVIRNADDPTLFQLYMHLSQNSIPQALKSVGTPVARGQFIARADNTGISTGPHLHFQVEHQPYWPSENPYWNTALDITFDDVDINGGRPRSKYYDQAYCKPSDICSVFRDSYISGNYYLGDSTPPTGELSGVNTGDVVDTPQITLSGWGRDDQSGFDYGQLTAYFNGAWHNLGPQFNPSFTYTWNFCNPDLLVPNGPVSVALLLYDVAGNPATLVGLRHFTQSYVCPIPPPSCVPNSNQVTLFEDSYYHGGCVKFNVGNYPTGSSLNPLGNDDADSILVGANVIATFYSEENYTGHSQAFSQNTAFLQYDWVYGNLLSSMRVSSSQSVPQAPSQQFPLTSSVFRQNDIIPFSWLNTGGATEYQAEIYLNGQLIRTSPWQSDPILYIDSLTEGNYTWRVKGRNGAGEGPWSSSSTFSILAPIIIANIESIPYSDDMETTQSKWVYSSNGLWRYVDDSSKARSGSRSWWYQNSLGDYSSDQPNSGSLTSPRISVTSTGFYLRFYYRYQTETQGTTWDQRWVQISVDDGPFVNLVQLYDDPQIPETASWLLNKAIDLSPYVGHIIRVRFQFTTFDKVNNNFAGWGIDDFSITSTPPISCAENRSDETPKSAFLLNYDPLLTVPGEICPNGDYDYYKFTGSAGDRIVADVDAMSNGSSLDPYLFLIDTDEKTVLAENDDEVYAERRDPLISYLLPKNGTYYLKLKAWKHPLVGGDNYFYSIRLYEDHVKPSASITWPASGSFLPDTIMQVTATVNDVSKGVNRVEFFWHPANWSSGSWQKIGTDWDGTDGWSMEFNPAGQPEGYGAAFYIQVFDNADNWTGAGAWNLGIDKAPPVTAMEPLATTQPSNAFMLRWTGSDNLSGIAYVEIQQKIDNGSWTTFTPIDGSFHQYWVIGEPGHTYSYRMHGVDHSGNSEDYPAGVEATTIVPTAGVLCYARDNYDTSGNDNSPLNASLIYPDQASQLHNDCNPLSPDYQNDEEWVKFNVNLGEHYFIHAHADSLPTSTVLSLYAADATTLLAELTPSTFGAHSYLIWTSDRDGLVYLRLHHVDGRVIGTDVATTLSVKTGNLSYLPLVSR